MAYLYSNFNKGVYKNLKKIYKCYNIKELPFTNSQDFWKPLYLYDYLWFSATVE